MQSLQIAAAGNALRAAHQPVPTFDLNFVNNDEPQVIVKRDSVSFHYVYSLKIASKNPAN